MTKRLVVLRHAKSDWPVGVADADRPLGRRGKRDAAAAGRWLAEHVGSPDLVWCSPARRTRETLELLSDQLHPAPPVQMDARVYEASLEDLLAVLRQTPKDDQCVLLVGHNPSVQDLVLTLAERQRGADLALTETKYPTSGLAVLDIPGKWADLGARGASLEMFVVPRG
jgi:phosphohistidine phosphatase